MRPGVAVRPRRSTTFVDGPIRGRISSFEPTATMRPPAMAMACATVSLASTVTTLPLFSTSSAAAGCASGRWRVEKKTRQTRMRPVVETMRRGRMGTSDARLLSPVLSGFAAALCPARRLFLALLGTVGAGPQQVIVHRAPGGVGVAGADGKVDFAVEAGGVAKRAQGGVLGGLAALIVEER